jgi:D-sedoheptulose 7-phosphate isomerase
MSRSIWKAHVKELDDLLTACSFRDIKQREIDADKGFAQWLRMTKIIRRKKNTIYLVGNGASASMASHMSADLAKNGQLHTEVFSDLSLITAISNDMGYEHVFSEPLSRRAKPGDMLVAISSSGKSPNVLAAARLARKMKVSVVTLSAMGEENPLRTLGDLNIYVAAKDYGFAETCHAAILHHWMDTVQVPLS